MRFLVAGLSLGVLAAGTVCAQAVISAHAGVVQYVEGRAFLADHAVASLPAVSTAGFPLR